MPRNKRSYSDDDGRAPQFDASLPLSSSEEPTAPQRYTLYTEEDEGDIFASGAENDLSSDSGLGFIDTKVTPDTYPGKKQPSTRRSAMRIRGKSKDAPAAGDLPEVENDGIYSNAQTVANDIADSASYPASGRQRNNVKSPPTRPLRQWPVVDFILDRRTHVFVACLLLLAAAVLAIVTFYDIVGGGSDQSAVANTTLGQMTDTGLGVDNIGGPVGAQVSHTFFDRWFGFGSLFIIIFLTVIGVRILARHKLHFWSVAFQCLLLCITTSLVLGWISYSWATTLNWGGDHGHYMIAWLYKNADFIGPLVVCSVAILLVCMVYFTRLSRVMAAARKKMHIARQQIELLNERRHHDDERMARDLNNHREEDPGTTPRPPQPSETINLDDIIDPATRPSYLDKPGKPDESAASDMSDNSDKADAYDNSYIADNSDKSDSSDKSYVFDDTDSTTPAKIGFDIDEMPADALTAEPSDPATDPMTINVADELPEATTDKNSVKDPTAELRRYHAPGLNLLDDPGDDNRVNVDMDELEANKRNILHALAQFNIRIAKIEATVGPTVTLFEVVPDEGVRIAQIKRVEEDLARSLSAEGIRIIAPIPGKGTVGIEVPNHQKQTVAIRTILASKAYQDSKAVLPLAMGTTIDNRVFIQDLAKVPHLLVGGATGTGKSVGLNTIIASLIYKRHPSELKFVLIDPKMVEFHTYERLIHHFLAKVDDDQDAVITDCERAKTVLQSLCVEMDQRYAMLRDAGVRQISEYNSKFLTGRLNPDNGHRFMPYIVVIVDEFTDLIMMAGKEIEMPVARIAQKARAVGIHMIIATQRPSSNVITGIIRANFTGRISFKVSTAIDSKVILDCMGANALIGRGDMLFNLNSRLDRVQCAYISNEEIERICDWVEREPGYVEPYILPDLPVDSSAPDGAVDTSRRDSLFEECARYVVQTGTASTSSFQRRWSIGYNRAGKIMDQLQEAGIVGAASGSKPRAVLVDSVTLESLLNP